MAIASALRVNSSLGSLYLYNNHTVRQNLVDVAFIDALRLNSVRPIEIYWHLYTFDIVTDDYERLMPLAEQSTSPSMLEFLLCVHSNPEKNQIKYERH